ncbi:hypothetical protein Sjap_019839 [Stephania japonica]|uniref:RING-type domain-containing protein n=1 Tax=Stephania japonica TaxID=461633 RepID=A0AAP0HZW6_9MAGN
MAAPPSSGLSFGPIAPLLEMSAPSSPGLSFEITVHPVEPGLPYYEPLTLVWEPDLPLLKVMFVALAVAIGLAFVGFFFLWLQNEQSPRQETNIELQSIRVENRPRVFGSVESIPLIKFEDTGDNLLYQQKDCRLCFDDFASLERLMVFPCHHAFHEACATHFLTTWNACPCCRHPVRPYI